MGGCSHETGSAQQNLIRPEHFVEVGSGVDAWGEARGGDEVFCF
jgi:hypothetical protein